MLMTVTPERVIMVYMYLGTYKIVTYCFCAPLKPTTSDSKNEFNNTNRYKIASFSTKILLCSYSCEHNFPLRTRRRQMKNKLHLFKQKFYYYFL